MKNIQIIDGAINCTFSIFGIPDSVFQELFPGENQDVEFLEDVVARLGEVRVGELMKYTWQSRLDKRHAHGIDGTLFIDLLGRKKFYPNKKESDLDNPHIQTKIRNGQN